MTNPLLSTLTSFLAPQRSKPTVNLHSRGNDTQRSHSRLVLNIHVSSESQEHVDNAKIVWFIFPLLEGQTTSKTGKELHQAIEIVLCDRHDSCSFQVFWSLRSMIKTVVVVFAIVVLELTDRLSVHLPEALVYFDQTTSRKVSCNKWRDSKRFVLASQ